MHLNVLEMKCSPSLLLSFTAIALCSNVWGQLAPGTPIDFNPDIQKSAFIDMDGDGDDDLLVPFAYWDVINWHENIGNGQFGEIQLFAQLENPRNIAVGDVDNDGDQDLEVGRPL